MRLSNKVLVTLGVAWAVFTGVTYFATQQYLMKSFLNIENVQVQTNINRVEQALDQISYALSTYTIDWAHWNDAYDYINGINPLFVPNNIDFSALINSNINLLIYMNVHGDIVFGIPFDIEHKVQTPYPAGLDKYIYPGSILEHQPNVNSNVRGLISLPSGIMLVAAAGMSYTDLSKPVNGTLIAGRYFSSSLLQKIADATSLALALYMPKDINASDKLSKVYQAAIKNKRGNIVILDSESKAYGYTVLYDLYKQPICMLRIELPRAIYNTGKKAIHFYLGVLLVTGIMLAGIIWFLLRILILNRLEFLNREIKEISNKKDYKRHINMKEKDELSSVAEEFNILMDTINMSHEQLKRQVREISQSEKKLEMTNVKLIQEIHERKQMQQKVDALHKKLILAARRAGMADIASGVLHNVGNILNNVTTSIGVAKEMVENSRVKNLNDLVQLLEQNKTDLVTFLTTDSRGTKVLEYLTMLAKTLSDDNQHLDSEVRNLDKHIGHIKDVITMQQSLTSVVGMIEELKVSDVIDDAFMLNKNLNKNNEIKIIYDNKFIGSVSLDRVKLLHVIVNLIKNAIESLHETNIKNKTISVRVTQINDLYFCIEVTDNGSGILPENLTNIFNYGFTTKKTGSGIGLHTSAVFIQEMGGKLYAKSNGPGQGATFFVELPIRPIKDQVMEDTESYFHNGE